jgi:NADPH:quinone reductase-like Zn-dependent oxidoreductase
MLDLMSSGRFHAVIDRKLPYTDVRKAHEIIEERRQFGKIVLTF